MKNFILMPLLPIVAIVIMKVCGTGHQDPYPYVDYSEQEIVDIYQEKEFTVTNEELAEHFYRLDHPEIEEREQRLKSIRYCGNSVEELESILDEHGINY
jgi:hypothetical protein